MDILATVLNDFEILDDVEQIFISFKIFFVKDIQHYFEEKGAYMLFYLVLEIGSINLGD